MNRLKQATAGALAALLALVLAAPAVAADPPDDGRDGNSSIILHKYAVDSLTPFTEHGDGTELSGGHVLYQPESGEAVTLNSLQPLPGVTFKITRVQDTDTDVDTATPLSGGDGYNSSDVTKADGTLVFDKLAFGVYLIEEVPVAGVSQPVSPFLVRVPMLHPDGDSWMYDIHVYPKNVTEDAPDIDKNIWDGENLIQSDTVNVGDTVTWQVDADIPVGVATGTKYTITDKIDSRLTYAGNLVVSYTDRDGNRVSLTADTDYKATLPTDGNGQTLTIDFPDAAMREKLALALGGDGDKDPVVTVRFDTTVNETARTEDNMGEQIPNKAKLEFTNSSGAEYAPESPEPEVHTGGVGILKVDGDVPSKKLAGAKFKIYATKEEAQAGTNALKAPGSAADEWEATTGADGYATFYGLAYGNYWIVETQAPADYNLVATPIPVTVNATSHLKANQVEVENRTGFTLPVTGGTGTVVFTVLGAVLVGGAGILLLLSRRKRTGK